MRELIGRIVHSPWSVVFVLALVLAFAGLAFPEDAVSGAAAFDEILYCD